MKLEKIANKLERTCSWSARALTGIERFVEDNTLLACAFGGEG
ncbi:MAG: hypothetical protein AAGA58_16045 [Verrucomicrobiota bacterium]